MKKSWLVVALLAVFPFSGFAEPPKNKNFFEILQSRIEECRNHFDIEPYFVLALGGEQDQSFTADFLESLQDFAENGRLVLPADKKDDAMAVSCATYAEGMMAGGISRMVVSGLVEAIADGLADALEEMLKPPAQPMD